MHQINKNLKKYLTQRQISNFINFRLEMNSKALILSLIISLAAVSVSVHVTSPIPSHQVQIQHVSTTSAEPSPVATSVEPSSPQQTSSSVTMPTEVSVQPILYSPIDTTNQGGSNQANEEIVKQEQSPDTGLNESTSEQNNTEDIENRSIESNQTIDMNIENETQTNQIQNDSSTIVVTSVDEEILTPQNQSQIVEEVNNTDVSEDQLTNTSEEIKQVQNNGSEVQVNMTEETGDITNDNDTLNQSSSLNESEGADGNQTLGLSNQTDNQTQVNQSETIVDGNQEQQDVDTGKDNLATAEVTTLPTTHVSGPEPTNFLPNPTKDLTPQGQQCLKKCRQLGGVSCKKWEGKQITCCKFTGCQWPFYCNPSSRIQVEGCENMP